MEKTSRNKSIVALIAFVLMLTIASVPFAAVSFAQEGPRSYTNPVPAPFGWGQQYTGPSPPPSPWYGASIGLPRYNFSNTNYNPASPAPGTSHMLWIHQYGYGGVMTTVGDPGTGIDPGIYFNPDTYNDVVAIGGRIFTGKSDARGPASIMSCLDEQTGEVVWERRLYDPVTGAPISMSFLAPNYNIRCTPNPERTPAYPMLDVYTFDKIYALSTYDGEILWVYQPPLFEQPKAWYYSPGLVDLGYPQGIILTQGIDNEVSAWQFDDNGYWGETSPGPAMLNISVWGPTPAPGGISAINDDVIIAASMQVGLMTAIDALTGDILWERSITGTCDYASIGYGMYFVPMSNGYYAYDIYTGDLVWSNTDITPSYWNEFSELVGDGVVANADVAGKVYAFDALNGSLLWSFETGVCPYEHYKSWYGTWPFHYAPIGADGKLYVAPGDDLPGSDVPGQLLYCLDLFTGELLWTFPDANMLHTSIGAIADGLLFQPSTLTSQLLCFGKGPTAVEVSIPKPWINKGDYVWITGSVMDQSPAQKGTPCVSKESMDDWMAYLHAGMPSPDKKTGVPVTFYATRTCDDTVFELGTVTTDGEYGTFTHNWIPPEEDLYTITAVFAGDDSYWDSWASAVVAVGPAPAAASNTSTVAAASMTIAAVAIMATCIVVAGRYSKNGKEAEKR